MYTMTYDSLLVDLRRYLERGFTEASDPIVYEQLPRLVTFAERRIANDTKFLGMLRAVTTPLQVGVAVYLKPDRWRDTVSMTVNSLPIFARSYEYIRNYWPDEDVTGTPAYYADYDYQHWIIAPTPDTADDWEILYYEQPAFLGDDNQSNWFTEYAPNLLLYAALLEATPFLKKDDRIATWQAMYEQAKGSLDTTDMKRIQDRASARMEA